MPTALINTAIPAFLWAIRLMVPRLSHLALMARSKSGMRVRGHRHPPTLSPYLTALVLAAASLELKAEKQSAHSHNVSSVAFSSDGKTIVSGSWDHTIKVWDAGVAHV